MHYENCSFNGIFLCMVSGIDHCRNSSYKIFGDWMVTIEGSVTSRGITLAGISINSTKFKNRDWECVNFGFIYGCTWASFQIRKIAGCACAGNAGNVSPGHRRLAIPTCITARASRTCRDACRDC